MLSLGEGKQGAGVLMAERQAGGQAELTVSTTWHSRDAEFKEEGETIMPPPCKEG